MQQIRRQKGFTLLELILVLLLIGLILGFSTFIVLGTTLPSARFSATARDLSTTIREARSLARVSGDKQTVIIDLDTGDLRDRGPQDKGDPRGHGHFDPRPLRGGDPKRTIPDRRPCLGGSRERNHRPAERQEDRKHPDGPDRRLGDHQAVDDLPRKWVK